MRSTKTIHSVFFHSGCDSFNWCNPFLQGKRGEKGREDV